MIKNNRAFFMREEEIIEDGKKVIEVRSPGGKLLYKKTPLGYEMKCPRTKQMCLVPYEQMIQDCLKCCSDESQQKIILDQVSKIRNSKNKNV